MKSVGQISTYLLKAPKVMGISQRIREWERNKGLVLGGGA